MPLIDPGSWEGVTAIHRTAAYEVGGAVSVLIRQGYIKELKELTSNSREVSILVDFITWIFSEEKVSRNA